MASPFGYSRARTSLIVLVGAPDATVALDVEIDGGTPLAGTYYLRVEQFGEQFVIPADYSYAAEIIAP